MFSIQCQKTPQNGEKFKDVAYDVDKLGTDPLRARMFAEKIPPDDAPLPKVICADGKRDHSRKSMAARAASD